jgi:hypothetical protein
MSELASSISRHLHSVDSVSQHKESQTEEKSVLTDLEGKNALLIKQKARTLKVINNPKIVLSRRKKISLLT